MLISCSTGNSQNTISDASVEMAPQSIYDYTILALDEESQINLADYRGKKILFVNVASKCGYTPQYEGLQNLYEKYGDKVQIIGFPCNQFMRQEPGSKEEIAEFCSANYGVTFPITTKINVKGEDKHPIYNWLTSKALNGVDDYSVSWNFNKFLVDEEGNLINYFGSKVEPESDELVAAINQ
jgi:glutathione peroxidase